MSALARWIATALAGIALVATAVGSSYYAGQKAADTRWQQRETDQAADANRRLLAAIEQGFAASAGLQAAISALQATHNQLQGTADELRSRVPLVVPRTAPRKAASVSAPAAQTAQPAGRSAAPDVAMDVAAVSADLSRAALWMWNSALAGRDVPAGTCGLADRSERACAPSSGVAIDAAIDNQGLNARSCALDRLRLQRLVDYLQQRQPRATSPAIP